MDVNSIIDRAWTETGLSDLGDPAVLEAIEVLVRASNEEANLSDAGAPRWEANLVGILSNRLRVIDHLKRLAQRGPGPPLPASLGGAQIRAACGGRLLA